MAARRRTSPNNQRDTGTTDPIERLRVICLAFPEAVEKSFGGHLAPSPRRAIA